MGNPASPPWETEIERGRGSQLLGDNSLHAAMGLHSAWCTMSGSTAFCYLCVLLQTNHVPALLAGLLVLSWIHISNIWCLCGTFQRQSLENNPVPCLWQQCPCGSCRVKRGLWRIRGRNIVPGDERNWTEYANMEKLVSQLHIHLTAISISQASVGINKLLIRFIKLLFPNERIQIKSKNSLNLDCTGYFAARSHGCSSPCSPSPLWYSQRVVNLSHLA